jgi:hypothetical protein
MSDAVRRGRPPIGDEAKRSSFNTRIREALKAQLEREAAAAGRSLSEEIETRLERSVDPGYGPDHGPMLHLIDQVVRTVDPRGQWRDDPAKGTLIIRGIARLLHRLQAPDDAHVFLDGSVEARIDELLFDLGNDGSDHPGSLAHVHRWSEEIRRRLGGLGPLLIEMRRAVREHLESMPPSKPPEADPQLVATWTPRLEREQAATLEDRARQAEEARQRSQQDHQAEEARHREEDKS